MKESQLTEAMDNDRQYCTECNHVIFDDGCACRKPARSPRSTALSCPCGFQGNTHNIREHRMNCQAWLAQIRVGDQTLEQKERGQPPID